MSEFFSLNSLAKVLILAGIILVLAGIVLVFLDKIPFFGKIPGNITITGKNFTVYIPLVSGLVLSLILTLILNLIFRK